MLLIALFFHHLPAQNITLDSSSIHINSMGFVDDGACPGFDNDMVLLAGTPLIAGHLGNQFAEYRGFNIKDATWDALLGHWVCYTVGNAKSYYALNGSGSQSVTFDWRSADNLFHDIELGVPYVGWTNSNSTLSATFNITGVPPGTRVKVFYSYDAYAGAFGAPESGEPDSASVIGGLMIDGKDLLQQAGYNFDFNTAGGPVAAFAQRGSSSGFFLATAGQPFQVDITGDHHNHIVDPGIPHFVIQQGMFWKDRGGTEFGGQLRLSVNQPIPPVQNPTLSEWSYFSLDIGSASEFSDPVANGTEYFDPGDAYKFHFPHPMPVGGLDGPIDDAALLGTDMMPSAPDPIVPHPTAAPVASGLSLSDVVGDYFDLDGLDRLDFVVNLDLGIIPVTADDCLPVIRHLFVSLDDDQPDNYLSNSVPFGAPNNSLSLSGAEYGSVAGRDEILQRDYSPVFGPSAFTFGIAPEGTIHSDLVPNPDPWDPADQEDDDVDALDLKTVLLPTGTCDVVYFSSDHEAPGVDINGLQLDPGVIYRGVAGGGYAPAILPSDLGLSPGTDIDAFEFGVMPTGFYPFNSGYFALLFSTDYDDPETVGIDESGGLSPGMIYWSYMDGVHYALDSIDYNDNVDAISLADESMFNITGAVWCNPYNFTDTPTGLMATISGGNVEISWDPYPYGIKCQIAGNKSTAANDVTRLVSGSQVNPPDQYSIPLATLQSGTQYRVKVRCGCTNPATEASPFSAYVYFTTPGPTPPPQPAGSGLFDTQIEFTVHPNPATDEVWLSSNTGQIEGSVALYDALGRVVHRRHVRFDDVASPVRLNVSDLPEGWYVVEWTGANSHHTEKLLIR